MMTCWICSGETDARSSARVMAMPPSCVAGRGGQAAPDLADGRAGGAEDHGSGICEASRASCESRSTTDAPTTTTADTIAVGVFEDEGIEPRPQRRAAALVDSGEASARAQLAVAHRGRAAVRRRRARRPGCFGPERARVAAARSRTGEGDRRATLCWEVPHHVTDAWSAGSWRARCSPPTRIDEFKGASEAGAAGARGAARLRAPRRERRGRARRGASPRPPTARATCRTAGERAHADARWPSARESRSARA